MSPSLDFLLSSVFAGDLAPAHRADLERSTITSETARAQFIRSVPPNLISPLLGFHVGGIQSAMLFPFLSPHGGFMSHVRVKVFPPLTDRKGHAVKYLQPKGSSPRLYFIAAGLGAVTAGIEPLWIVEGEKKSLAVAQQGLPAVGICGVEGWHCAGSRRLLADFENIPLRGRCAELVPDGDVATNPSVAHAVERLAEALEARGAVVRLVRLPIGEAS
jgi:Domain of unknown function (DUF3854)